MITNGTRGTAAGLVALAATCVLGACSSDDPGDGAATGASGADAIAPIAPPSDDGAASSEPGPGIPAPDAPDPDPLTVVADGPVSAVGVITLNRTATLAGGATTLGASFAELAAPRDVGEVLEDFLPELDTCTMERGRIDALGGDGAADVPFEPLGAGPDDAGARSIGAGDALVFTSVGGTWATLPRRERDGFVAYTSEGVELPEPVPDGLVVDVPGEAFPAFAAVPVPVVPPLTGLSPGPFEPVTSGTVFRWDVVDEPREVAIDVLGIDADTLETVSIGCRVTDDGEFALVDAAGEALGEGMRGVAAGIRRGTTAVREGDALLIVTGATAEAGTR